MALCCAIGAALVFTVPARVWAQSTGPLTLGSAVQRALTANPRLHAARFDVGIATGKEIQAGVRPNPELSYEIDNAFGSGQYHGLHSAETTLQISQLFEFPGKRRSRVVAAAAEVDSSVLELEALRLEISSDTAVAFFTVLAAQHRIQILDAQIAALDRLTPLLQRRVEAGASSPGETARAQAAADLVRADRERSRTMLAIARRQLATLMGATVPDFARVAGNLARVGSPPPFQTVLEVIDTLPQLVRFTAVRARRDAELILAQLRPYPDLRVGVGWRHFNETSDDAMRLSFSLPLPIFDRNIGGIVAAQEARAKVQAEWATNKLALILTLGRAYETLAGAAREIDILRTAALPNARRAAEAIESGYAQGRFTLLEVLDIQNTVTQGSLRELEALMNFHTSVATIEGLTGTPLRLTRERTR
ncbi:MAG: TolC family protein [Hyphomonadaceae bacterium]|nr:TolC family protein [Hyphomonadaceae bacterium]